MRLTTLAALLGGLLLANIATAAVPAAPAFTPPLTDRQVGVWQFEKPVAMTLRDGSLTLKPKQGETVTLHSGTSPQQLLELNADTTYQWQLSASGAPGSKVRLFADYRSADNRWMHRDQTAEITLDATAKTVSLPLLLPAYCTKINLGIEVNGSEVTLAGPQLQPAPLPVTAVKREQRPEFWVNVDYYDEIAYSDSVGYDNYHREAIAKLFQQLRAKGVTGVQWRISLHGQVLYHSKRFTMPPGRTAPELLDQYTQKSIAMMKEFDPLAVAVAEAKKNGIELYVWVTLADEAGTEKNHPEISASDFLLDHPQYALVDRSGKPLWGSLCYSIPAVRAYRLAMIRELAEYGADGIFLCNRSHAYRHGRDTGDNYGFNQEIVDAYQQRYGVDIRKEPFDHEKRQELRAEGFDQLIEEAADILHARNQKLRIGVLDPTTEYWNRWVFGNARFPWKKYVANGWVDSVVLGDGILTANKMIEANRAFRSVARPEQQPLFWMQLYDYGQNKSVPGAYMNRLTELLSQLGGRGGVFHESINLEVSEPYFNELTKPYQE